MRIDRSRESNRLVLEKYLTERSGFHTAEAIGIIIAKLAALALAGVLVWALTMAFADGILGFVILAVFLVPCILASVGIGLFVCNGLVRETLRPKNRFRRPRRPSSRSRRAALGAAPPPAPRGPRPRSRTVVLLILSTPALLVLLHILSAYAERFLDGVRFRWLAWGYTGIALEPLSFVTSRWPIPTLTVAVISLLCLLTLLGIALRSAGRRLGASLRARWTERTERAASGVLPELPASALRSSPRGQADLFARTALFLLLGLPSAYLLGYCLLAYLDHLWLMWSSPIVDSWAWSAPEDLSAFGEWFFTDDHLSLKVLAPTVSAVFLTMGVALVGLAVPLLTRRGADAIDLAVTGTGAIVRGGLALGWHEIAEVMIVRDRRITSWIGSQEVRVVGQPRLALHPTYIAGHSRTRVALVLRDVAEVDARTARSVHDQRLSLRADGTLTSGYALCDLWVHSEDAVSTILAALSSGAARARVPVTELERTTRGSSPEEYPGWFRALLVR